MADVGIKSAWTIQLDTVELRLILKALGGRLKNGDLEAAKALGDRLTVARIQATKTALRQADDTLKALDD